MPIPTYPSPWYCHPDHCDQCFALGSEEDNDYGCEILREKVIEHGEPTEHYMAEGCLYRPCQT